MFKFLTLIFVLVLLSFNNAQARTSINSYWTIESNYSDRNCNIMTEYNNNSAMFVIASSNKVHIVLRDPSFSRIADGNYDLQFYFDNRPDLNGHAKLKGNLIYLLDLSVNAVESLMSANVVGIRSGTYNKTFSLNQSDHAIRMMIQCVNENGF